MYEKSGRANRVPVIVTIVADTHLPRGRRALPDECRDRLCDSDLIIHAGDFVSGAALTELEALGPPVAAVHGNMDAPELRRRLPARRTVDVEELEIGLVHDAGPARGRLERLRRLFPTAVAVVFGHSHRPLHETSNGFQVFNPGSPTERRRAATHTMGIARIRGGRIEFELVKLD